MGNFIFSVIQDYDLSDKIINGNRSKTKNSGNAATANSDGDKKDNNDINEDPGEVVVIPVDGSKQADYAFNWYVYRLHRPNNLVYVVHCTDTEQMSGKHYPDYAVAPEEWTKKVREMKAKGEGMLVKYQKKLEAHKINGRTFSDIGRPGPMIVAVSDRFGATMVVMGTRGLGMIRRSFLGSVSTYVLHHADIPVIIIPHMKKPHVYF